jgi:hypothetical protein
VQRYFQEPGHEWIETLHDPAQGHELYIAQTALVEVVASKCLVELARLHIPKLDNPIMTPMITIPDRYALAKL